MFGRWQLAILTACCVVAMTRPCRAAGEPEVLLEDNFSTYSTDFGTATETQGVKDNVLHVSIDPKTWNKKLYQSKRLGDVDATVHVRLSKPTAKEGAEVGFVFWASESGDYYSLTILDTGLCGVQYARAGKNYSPVQFQKVDGMKAAPGEWNELRVVTQGARATAYINGQKFASFRGHPPKDGGMLGFLTWPGKQPLTTAEYSALKVVRPPDDGPKNYAHPNENLIFALDPDRFDPGWGLENAAKGLNNGAMFLKPEPTHYTWVVFTGDGSNEMSVKAKVRMADGDEKSHGRVGLAFWSTIPADAYLFILTDDGTIEAAHRHDGKVEYPVPATPVPTAAQLNLKDWTELRVSQKESRATLFVNGMRVGLIENPDRKGPFEFGIFAESGAAQCVAEFSEIVVVRLDSSPFPLAK
jgi:hypothetical protein